MSIILVVNVELKMIEIVHEVLCNTVEEVLS